VVSDGAAPLAMARTISRTVSSINAQVPVYRMSMLEQRVDVFLTRRRFEMFLLSLFAGAAILLAALGTLGLMRYVVTQRTREIGIRMALGASRLEVVALVLREGLAVTGVGLIVGLLLAFALTSAMRSLIFGVSTTDSLTFTVAPLLLVFVSLVACAEPTWRAIQVDPIHALRAD